MLAGLMVGVFTSGFGYLYAQWANRRWEIPLRDSTETPLADLDRWIERPAAELPPLWLALIPVLLPVILIGGNSILQLVAPRAPVPEGVLGLGRNLGEPAFALALSTAIALGTLAWRRREELAAMSTAIQSALSGGGLIILITAAGGAFGGVLQQTGIGERIQELSVSYHLPVLPLAFLLTALVRTAQGSATVAMITTVGLVSSMADPAQLGFHPVYLALAIGCGSKPFAWMNDSGFWVIGKMSGMTIPETFRTFSCMVSVMAVGGLVITMILARLFPMI
jgi:gluconate:H+ symporter, GntP family